MKVGENVIVRVANEERLLNPDEEYFVAKIEQDVLQLNEAGTSSTVAFKKVTGLFLCVGIFWVLQRQTGKETDSTEKGILDGFLGMLLSGASQS